MQEKTVREYQSIASHFYATRIRGEVTSRNIISALKQSAHHYRPGYFRRLKNALRIDQHIKGFHKTAKLISKTKNPVTSGEGGLAILQKPKRKQPRVKHVSHSDFVKLATAAKEKKDYQLLAALKIAQTLGCRPAEMESIEFLGGNTINIKSVKKIENEHGDDVRGLDRQILLTEKIYGKVQSWCRIVHSTEHGKSGRMSILQGRLKRLTRKVYPRRKKHITFYSFRHQKGSDLKASGMSRIEIAYLMGHQSTESIEVYGNRRCASEMLTPLKPGVTIAEIVKLVRENHREPLSNLNKQLLCKNNNKESRKL